MKNLLIPSSKPTLASIAASLRSTDSGIRSFKTRYSRIRQLVMQRQHDTLYKEFKLWITPNTGEIGWQNYPNGLYDPAVQRKEDKIEAANVVQKLDLSTLKLKIKIK